MVEPDRKNPNKPNDLEDTVRNLREENAKLLQILRSQGLLPDTTDTTNITFDHSDLTLTTNSTNTTNQINHQHITNHDTTNQQNFTEQIIHGNQSNLTPNFNTVIQSTNQPFVQNNSNTLVQNNTNLIQPINLVNFNNVNIDSIQSFLASQNNVVYLPTSTTTTTTTTTSTVSTNSNAKESRPSAIHSLLNPSPIDHQVSIRPKPSVLHQHQELVPVIPKMKAEHYESITRQYSSTSNDPTNSTDNDSNDPKQKHPRPIRPKPSARAHSVQTYKSVIVNEKKSTSFVSNNSSPTVSLFSSPSYSSSPSTNYISQSTIEFQTDHPSQLNHSTSLDLSLSSSTKNAKKKDRIRPTKKSSTSSTNQTHVPIAPIFGRPLAPAPSNIQRSITSNNPITKRSTKKSVKHNSKTSLIQYHSENLLQQQNASSPSSNSFAESISGLLENFDQELMASNFLSQATTNNLLTDENHSIISSNTNLLEQNQDIYHTTTTSMSTLDQFTNRLENETILTNPIVQDFNVENEQITSFMSEEDMQLVEINFDENTFLKQFDLDDASLKLSAHADQNLFANILTNNQDLIQTQQINEQSTISQNSSISLSLPSSSVLVPPPPPPSLPPLYSGSSLINNNVFTTVVPLGSQQKYNSLTTTIVNNTTRLLPEEGVQLTARHIEPSQVATYESAKYQDILDDLVMVTDQEVLRHAQATAAGDSTDVLTTDFSFALLEVTNEIIKNTNIQIIDENSTTFHDLQYLYPIEQEILQKQLENRSDQSQEKQTHELQSDQPPEDILHHQKQPIVVLEKLQSQILASVDIHRDMSHDNVNQTSITDLSSILQFQSIQSPNQHETSTTNLITPIRPTKTIASKSPVQQIDFDSLVSPTTQTYASNKNKDSLQSQKRSNEISKPCILFEPISSSSKSPSPTKSTENEMIIDSGRLEDLSANKTDLIANDNDLQELLNDSIDKPYEIIENQGQTSIQNHVHVDDVDELIEQIEQTDNQSKRTDLLLEQTFSRYQEKYQLNLQREQENSEQQSDEQLLTIPPVKLKLNSIYVNTSSKKKKRSQSPSPLPSPDQQIDNQPPTVEHPAPINRPPLKIKIRTKLPTPPPPAPSPPRVSSKEKTPNKKTHKSKKKKSQHSHQQQKKSKTTTEQMDTEYAGLTRFEQPLAQLYRQQSPPTPDDLLSKDEHSNSPILLSSSSNPTSSSQIESQSSTTLHSGFIIDEQTPPSSIPSIEHRQSPPPLLNQTRNEQLKQNYSHLFNYENNHHHHHHHNQEQQNNTTFITPPPEIDIIHQKTSSYENYCTFPNTSPEKKKQKNRKISITSSTSSKSLTNIDYSLDTQALEPVSPTPITTSSKSKHTQNTTSTTVNYNDVVPLYYDHEQQQKQLKDHHSRKSTSSSCSSSSHRSSRPASSSSSSTTTTSASQMYSQSRSLSNHNYRTAQEAPLIPPILPPPPPPMHLDPYTQTYHHPFVPPAGAPAPFFNFPFSHPFLNPHTTPATSHYHHPSMKYHHPHSHHHHHHHSHPSSHHHSYPTHQQQYPYHSHLQRQPPYNNSNYMSSRDHHSFDR